MSPKVSWKGRLVALFIGLFMTVGVAELALRIAMPTWKEFYNGHFMSRIEVPNHGSVHIGKPGFDGYFSQNNGDFRVRIKINEFGLRNNQPVSTANNKVWVVGDSMAFGWGVEESESYTSKLREFAQLPAFNIASPGTDVCGYQRLVARMPREVKPQGVVVGLVLENDIRHYNCRPEPTKTAAPAQAGETVYLVHAKIYLTKHSALYNILALSLKRVTVITDSLVALGLVNKEHAYKRSLKEDEMATAVAATTRELLVLKNQFSPHIPFVVMVAPARFEIKNADPHYRKLRVTLVEALKQAGIDSVDPLPGFVSAGFEPTHFRHDGHWSPLGHEIAAKAIAQWWKAQP